ncbi:SGNH/GDSL hydrolase family protein [Arthrobacter sp. SAFR-014]|uniref:SGNH/GDSL hydrolase family protein n=1 Tax=unclassified Arthrobacter TaxID=235627 RepID=UPI003F7B8624
MDPVTLGMAKAAAKKNQAPIRALAPGFEVVNPRGLRRWYAALAGALHAPAVAVVCGDSITVGIGADNTGLDGDAVMFRTRGYVAQTRDLIASRYGDPGEGYIGSKDYGYVPSGTPTRRTYAGGGLTDEGQGPFYNGSKLASATQTVTFNTSAGTIIKFWVWTGGTGTGATFAIDGGSNTASYVDPADGVTKTTAANTIPTNGTGDVNSLTWTEYTISGLADTTHTVVFTGPTSAGTLRIGDIAVLKKATGVQVHRLGWSGATTANLVGKDAALNANTLAPLRMTTANAKMFGAKLVVLAFGANDYGNQNNLSTSLAQPGTTPTQYAANLKQAGDAAIANGACVLLVAGPRRPTKPSPETYTEADYYNAAKAIAQANDHYAFVDMAQMIGDNATAQTMGYLNSTSVHPMRIGHGRIGQGFSSILLAPMGIDAPTG